MEHSLRLAARTARADIVSGVLRGGALLEQLHAISYADRDVWIDEVLGIEPLPEDSPDLPAGAVPYLPCGVDDIVALVREVPLGPTDELVDVGSGLGRVAILAHLLSGTRAAGVEIQEHLVVKARATCVELGLADVSFSCANAADHELDGAVFFLYAPCNGALLTRVLARIEDVARRRAIVVGCVGLELPDVHWLRPRATASPSLKLYASP